jgi:hypothetical protein
LPCAGENGVDDGIRLRQRDGAHALVSRENPYGNQKRAPMAVAIRWCTNSDGLLRWRENEEVQ